MIELTTDEATKEFSDKLQSGEFILSRSPNSEVDYSDEKLNRDMAAVDEFLKTDMIEFIMKLV
jgi:hypothetical protein